MLTLFLAVLLGTTLASYLYWVRTQNLLVAESQAWNAALAIAEAGVEEGMAQINVNVGNVGAPNLLDYSSSINNNWPPAGPGPHSKSNPNLGYSVIVSNDVPPTIFSTGTSSVPILGQPVTRTVMVKTMTNSLFGVAIAAMTSVNNKGNNITVDAYDSADTNRFPGGLYNATNAFAGGDVSLAAGIIGVGNSDIHGRLFMGPSGNYNLGPNGLVGDMPWNWPAQSGVESPNSDWLFNDFNRDFPDVSAPYSSGLNPGSYYYNPTNTYFLGNGNYYLNNDFSLNNNQVLYVAGTATLYVTGNFNAKNGSQIAIGPGGILKLYLGTTAGPAVSCVFNVVNSAPPNNAFNFQVFGLPSLTSFTLGGNDTYMGTLYAPEAVFTLSGGGSSSLDYQGAVVVSSITMNGHFSLHYDKNLSRVGPPKGYTLAYWYEL
jgi:hypothetical protein